MVDFPVVLLAAAGRLFDCKVAAHIDAEIRNVLLRNRFAMIVENTIIRAELGCIVGRSSRNNSLAAADSPPIVFVPIRIVASADIADAAFICCLKPGFAKARCAFCEGAGNAAISNCQTILMSIGQAVNIRNRERRVCPTVMASVCSVIDIAYTVVDRLNNRSGRTGTIRSRIQPHMRGDSVRGIEI